MKLPLLFCLVFFVFGCAGTPKPSDRALQSVSFVNTGTGSYEHLRLTLDGAAAAARLETLGPYREEWQDFNQALSVRPRVTLSWVWEGQTVMAPAQFLNPPVRRAGDRRYHLRVHLQGGSFVAELEPHSLARDRWILRAAGGS